MRKIIITGKGKLSVTPDIAIISFPLEFEAYEYGAAVYGINNMVEGLRNCIQECGIDRKELKTRSFSVNSYTKEEKITKEYIFAGFRASHSMKLEIPLDTKLISKIVMGITKLDKDIEFRLGFGVKDSDACFDELLRNAIVNAKEKAEVIADASGVKLMEIMKVDYSFADIYLHSDTDMYLDTYENKCYSDHVLEEITPEDIDVKDNVTVTWRIE